MTRPTALTIRTHPAGPFLAIGGACVIAGVAQVAVGAGQAWLADHGPRPPLLVVELATWNLGNAAVIVGTVSGLTPVVDAGGGLLVIALALLLAAVRSPRQAGWPLILYRALIVIVGVSIPVGLVLAELKPR